MKRTAVNVKLMYDLLPKKGWLGMNHRTKEGVVNWLAHDQFAVLEQRFVEPLMNVDCKGREVALFHMSAKMDEMFGEIIQADVDKHVLLIGKKRLTKKWTTKFRIKNMRELNPSMKDREKGVKRKGSRDTISSVFFKHTRKISNIKDRLNEIKGESSVDRRACARILLEGMKRK